jgi:RNA polymerase sigma-54 factor
MVALSSQLYTQGRLQQTVSPQVVLQSQILELSADDLRERIEAELHENPALEMADEVCLLPAPPRSAAFEYEGVEALDRLPAPYTLADDLRLQLAGVSGARRDACEYLIECLDERGFLDADLPEVAALLGVRLADVQAAVTVLQTLEPAGIAARDLRESLLLQIERLPKGEVPPHAAQFVSAYLGGSRRGTPAQTAAALGLTEGDVGRLTRFISARLYMWPAEKFRAEQDCSGQSDDTISPDALINEYEGELRVKVSQSWSHSLRVSDAYARLEREMEASQTAASAEHERLVERIRDARCFIHQLTRRETMLQRVTEAVVAAQRAYFDEGPQALQPLTRKEIAAALQVHESTISRITRHKYVQLPNTQLVPFDFFFDASLSAKAVLRHLIERESPQHPLADVVLAERLEAAGYPLARRTVAKYRDQLGIPPAHERRRA